MLNHLICFVAICFLLVSCDSNERNSNSSNVKNSNTSQKVSSFSSHDKKRSSKIQNELVFNVDIISAVNFIQRSGRILSEQEKNEIQNESVLKIEVNTVNMKIKNLLSEKSVLKSKDESMKYILSGLTHDVQIKQGKRTFSPTGVEMEQGVISNNKFGVFLFFKDIDLNKKIDITYYDLLFGTGIQKFSIDKIRKHDS